MPPTQGTRLDAVEETLESLQSSILELEGTIEETIYEKIFREETDENEGRIKSEV